MILGLTQIPTANPERPLAWTVVRYEPGCRPQAAGIHDELPSELVTWARELNAANTVAPHGFGIIDRASVAGQTLCCIEIRDFVPLDDRGRWLCAVGFGAGSSRPRGLGLPAAWKHCPALAAILDGFYGGQSSKPAPPAPPPAPKPLTPAEKVDVAKQSLYDSLAFGFASRNSKSEIDVANARAALAAIVQLIDLKLST